MTSQERILTLTMSVAIGCLAFAAGLGCQQTEIEAKEMQIQDLKATVEEQDACIKFCRVYTEQILKDLSEVAKQKQQLEIETKETRSETAVSAAIGQEETFEATAYTQTGRTATGFDLSGHSWESAMVIAVDPSIIPLGSQVNVEFDGEWAPYSGVYTAADTGGAIRGHTIDVFVGHGEDDIARQFGRRNVRVAVL